jgi:hypothetical protein
VIESATHWTQIDCNEETRKEIEAMIVKDDIKGITKRFDKRLTFSEPGIISAKLGGGFSRINYVTI